MMLDLLNNKIIANEYNKDNYIIAINNESDSIAGLCVIYFSSNDIWFGK